MTEPTDAEIVALADATRTAEGGANGYILPISFCRAVLAKWGTLRAENIVIPTDTMEQELQKHYQRGYEAGKKAATSQPTQAADSALDDAVPLDEARRLFDAGWKAAALFCDREDVVADGIIGFGACPQFEAAFSAANGIKGGQHGTS